MNINNQILFTAFFSAGFLVFVVISRSLYLRWKRWSVADKTTTEFVNRLVVLFVLIIAARSVLMVFPDFWVIGSVVAAPLDFASQVLPVLAAIWLVWRLKPGNNESGVLGATEASEQMVKDAAFSVFNSEHFLSALRTSLPKGEDDSKHGLDFIPFMLQSIDERRRSFQHSAKIFFWTTIIVGVVFAATVAIFGYLLVNEASAGTPKRVKSLEEAASFMKTQLGVIVPVAFPNKLFEDSCRDSLKELQKATPPPSLTTSHQRITVLIENLSMQNDIGTLVDAIQKQADEATEDPYRKLATTAAQRLASFQKSYEAARMALPNALEALSAATKEVRGKLDEDRNQLTELLRRICIGLVVASFFFAILRYVAGLYRKDYEQVRLAYEEDLALRRFYVAYKSSEGSAKDRSVVIAALMKSNATAHSTDSADTNLGMNKAEADTIKKIIDFMDKKIN